MEGIGGWELLVRCSVGMRSAVEASPMGVVRFEDLRVWQAAKGLCDEIGALIQRPSLQSDHAIRTQLNSASLSTMANIAEGFMRGGSKEFAQFVRIAAGSNAEVRALLHAAFGRKYRQDRV